MKRVTQTAIVIIMLLSLVLPGFCTTYYVDTASSSGGDGTTTATSGAQAAFATLTAVNAVGYNPATNDQILFKCGQTFSGQLFPSNILYWNTGSVTIGKYDTGANPIIQGSGSAYALKLESNCLSATSSLTIQDLTFTNAGYTCGNVEPYFADIAGLTIQRCKFTTSGTADNIKCLRFANYDKDTHNVIITYCEFNSTATGTNDEGLYFENGSGKTTYDFTITYNNIHNVCRGIIWALDTSSQPYGINISNNSISYTKGEGIKTEAGMKTISGHVSYIGYNTLTNIGDGSLPTNAIELQYCTGPNFIVEHNTIDTVLSVSTSDGCGIELDWTNTSTSYPCSYLTIRYNSISNCSTANHAVGIEVYCGDHNQIYYNRIWNIAYAGMRNVGATSTDNSYWNNTVYNVTNNGFQADYPGGYTPSPAAVVRNNIFHTGAYGIYVSTGATLPTEDHNSIYGMSTNNYWLEGTGAQSLAETDKTTNPLFVSTVTPDFHLLLNSPCINAGVGVGLTRDYEGKIVPQGGAPDIGAYESIMGSHWPGF